MFVCVCVSARVFVCAGGGVLGIGRMDKERNDFRWYVGLRVRVHARIPQGTQVNLTIYASVFCIRITLNRRSTTQYKRCGGTRLSEMK